MLYSHKTGGQKKDNFSHSAAMATALFRTSSEIMIGFMQFLEITYLVINGLLV